MGDDEDALGRRVSFYLGEVSAQVRGRIVINLGMVMIWVMRKGHWAAGVSCSKGEFLMQVRGSIVIT